MNRPKTSAKVWRVTWYVDEPKVEVLRIEGLEIYQRWFHANAEARKEDAKRSQSLTVPLCIIDVASSVGNWRWVSDLTIYPRKGTIQQPEGVPNVNKTDKSNFRTKCEKMVLPARTHFWMTFSGAFGEMKIWREPSLKLIWINNLIKCIFPNASVKVIQKWGNWQVSEVGLERCRRHIGWRNGVENVCKWFRKRKTHDPSRWSRTEISVKKLTWEFEKWTKREPTGLPLTSRWLSRCILGPLYGSLFWMTSGRENTMNCDFSSTTPSLNY